MDEFEKENKELHAVERDLHKKFKNKGLTKQQIEFKMMQLDVEFLIHVYVNGDSKDNIASIKKRLRFYTDTLKMHGAEE